MRRRPVLTAALVATGLLIVTFGVVLPRGREVTRIEAAVAAADLELQDLRLQLAVLASTPTADVAAELAAVRAQVPASPMVPDLLRMLSAASADAGVKLGGVTLAGGSAPIGGATPIGLTLSASGSYFGLARFLFELEHLERLIRISGMSVSSGQGGLTMSITAQAFTTDPSFGPGADPAPGTEVGA